MGRIAGVPNKLTSEVKEKLQKLVEGVVDTLDITEMTIDQKIKLLQIINNKNYSHPPNNGCFFWIL